MKREALILLVLLAPLCTAFGVSPASTELLDPASDEFSINIINSEQQALTATLRTEGSAAQFLTLGQERVELDASEQRTSVPVQVDVPSEALPGIYTGAVVVEQRREQVPGENVVTAVPAVKHRVEIIVPNDGTFVRTKIRTSSLAQNTTVDVTLAVQNIGTQPVESLQGRVDVFGGDGELIETLRTPDASLPVGEKRNLVAQWRPPSAGRYKLRATTTFDGRSQTTEQEVRVGSLDLRLGEPQLSSFSIGEVARIDIPVTSTWNEPLRNVNARVRVTDEQGTVVADFPSLSTDVPALGDATVTAYWNTAGLVPGNYDIEAALNFGGQQKVLEFGVGVGVSGAQVSHPGQHTARWVSLGIAALALIGYLLITFIKRRR